METVDVVAFRQQFDKAYCILYNKKDGTEKRFLPPIHVCCDNSLNVIDDRLGSVIWDDANSRFYWFRVNGPGSFINSPTSAMNFGSKVLVPGLIIAVDYGEIQNMRIIVSEEMLDRFMEGLGALMTEEQKEHVRHLILDETDMENIIQRKQTVSYVTGMPKNQRLTQKHYSDMDEYNKTVHSN